MSYTAPELHDTLVELSTDITDPFALAEDVTESDIETWLSAQDASTLESQYDDQITRETISSLDGMATDTHTLREIIESRNDTPEDFEAGYAIRADRTIVQYHKPWIGGKEPMTEAEADSIREEHVGKMVERAVNSELLDRAKAEFGVSS